MSQIQTFDEKEIAVAANAIGWVFFGEESENGVVEVDPEDSNKCYEAAKRALLQIEGYRSAKEED